MAFQKALPFGSNVERIKSEASKLANHARGIARYIEDTKYRPGQADYDLIAAAEMLEHGARQASETARDLRRLGERIRQERADLSNHRLTAAE